MATYRAAIVGLTGIGADPAFPARNPALGDVMPGSHAAAYAQTPGTDVVAVCDLVPERIAEFRRAWGDVFPRARPYANHRELLAGERIDLLSVVTSDHRHADIVADAAA